MSGNPRVGVQGIVTKRREPTVVLLGRRRGGYGEGEWALPGGHLEFGESFESAAQRELLEEAGIRAYGLEYWNSYNTYDKAAGTHYVQIAVMAHGYIGEPQVCEPEKCYQFDWFDIRALPDALFRPSVPFLKRLASVAAFRSLRVPSTTLILTLQDEVRNVARYVVYEVEGLGERVTARLGRLGESRDRQVRSYSAELGVDLLEWISGDLSKREQHGYALTSISSSVPFDWLISVVPRSLFLGWLKNGGDGSLAGVPSSDDCQPSLFDAEQSVDL